MVKKLLAVLLAAMMMCGVFAVGVSAVSFEDFMNLKKSATLSAAEGSAPAIVQGEDDDKFAEDFVDFLYAAELYAGAKLESSSAAMACVYFMHNENSFKNRKAQKDFNDALESALKDSAEHKARDTFMNDSAAIKAAYTDGSLRGKLIDLHLACAIREIAIYEKLVPEYFIPDAMVFGEEFRKITSLTLALAGSGVTKEQRAEINAKIDAIATDELNAKLLKAIDEGDAKEAARIVTYVRKEYEKVLAEYGIVEISPEPEPEPSPSFFAKLWNFILKWFFFGWLWMK